MRTRRIVTFVLATLLALIFVLSGCGKEESGKRFKLFYYNESAGSVISNVDGLGTVPSGKEVTVEASAYNGYCFVGWTENAYLDDYGTLVSEEEVYTFTMDETTKYYANFIRDNEAYVCYYANGGILNHDDAKDGRLIQKWTINQHVCPSTFAQNGMFSREGYVLTEYNSAADGTGEATNLGQRVFSKAKIIHLYAQWSQYTDESAFEFSKTGNGWFVTGYNGQDEKITVPAQHEGEAVIGIEENAINSKSVTTLVLPESITAIKDNAFAGCSSLETVYLYDVITEMKDAAFHGCPIRTVCLNSVYDKKYRAEGAGKLEALFAKKDDATNRLVVVSGSSGVYGTDAALLQESLDKEYNVINFGLQITIPCSFAMDIIKCYLQSGDVVVLAPECELRQIDYAINTTPFVRYDGAFTSFRNIDMREYRDFFTSLSTYSLAKANETEGLMDAENQFFTYTGDSGNSHSTVAFPPTYQFKDPTKHTDMTDAVYQHLNRSIDALKDSGVKVYLSFAPFCTEACMDTVTKEDLDAYSKALASKLHAVCISTQSNHDYEAKYFFEMFHMTNEGKNVHTKRLIEELNAQFEKES